MQIEAEDRFNNGAHPLSPEIRWWQALLSLSEAASPSWHQYFANLALTEHALPPVKGGLFSDPQGKGHDD